ncbi:hypothetical protein Nepgr_027954 [Nepenthes gracilis]|uniref:DUF220 domain-containing protein n=1 Tax=Nepenthes gracilis TaxID=150966 RepID=A0AAD3TBH6_NEPGR|nr:hypothetical protein Nepgr_027954 [Nepenthes gracilis]
MGKMDEKNVSKTRQQNDTSQHPIVIHPAFSTFITQVPRKLQDFLTSRFKRSEEVEGKGSTEPILRKEQKSTDWEVNLDKQLKIWRENPLWGDQPPEITVSVPKGSLCNLHVKVDVGLPPDAVYNIVIDPDNKRVFKNIKEVISRRVLVDEGFRQVVELDQAAIWRFLWWSGTISVHVLVDQNRKDYSMKFKQVKAGFMKKFEGCWKVEPIFVDEEVCFPFKPKTMADYHSCTQGKGRIGSRVSLQQLLQPAIVPPPPISWYLRGITARTTEMLINDLIAESARIKEVSADAGNSTGLAQQSYQNVDGICDVKERWAMRRRNRRLIRK